jgi:hypothetical protein
MLLQHSSHNFKNYFISLIVISSSPFFGCNAVESKVNSSCTCDTIKLKRTISDNAFNRLEPYDNEIKNATQFYQLDSVANRLLWYRDVAHPDSTRFTSLWNDYVDANYHASHLDFIKYYTGKKDIELAFQFGPNMDLWAYHIFVVRQVDCCYLVTRSYFRHARFVYKAYAIAEIKQLDSLYAILDKVNQQPLPATETFDYLGSFADNRHQRSFIINFKQEMIDSADVKIPKPEISELYKLVDESLNWSKTYGF